MYIRNILILFSDFTDISYRVQNVRMTEKYEENIIKLKNKLP